ncbi:MAG: hypothetical protein ACRC1I_18100 [Pseudomonas proteolytica]|uniref:hypothetical protein n=1 Tax=Pseudomonas proteolytica TaxID=219574 RepID=UPI003F2E44AD
MDPISMISGAASTLMPLLAKGMEMGMDMLKNGMDGAAGAGGAAPQLGQDQQQPAPAQISF